MGGKITMHEGANFEAGMNFAQILSVESNFFVVGSW
jgi:hypothetical protein